MTREEAITIIKTIVYMACEEDDFPEGADEAIDMAIEALKADRPMVIKCKPFLSEEDFKAFAEQVSDQNVILIPYEAEVVSTNTSTKSTNISTKSTNISTDASADRPRGEWIDRSDGIEGAWDYCSVCGEQAIDLYDYCPNCGAKMDGERSEE